MRFIAAFFNSQIGLAFIVIVLILLCLGGAGFLVEPYVEAPCPPCDPTQITRIFTIP